VSGGDEKNNDDELEKIAEQAESGEDISKHFTEDYFSVVPLKVKTKTRRNKTLARVKESMEDEKRQGEISQIRALQMAPRTNRSITPARISLL
jgi:predicted solute-binding protein